VQAAGEARGGNEAVFAGLLDEFLQEGLRSRAYDAEWIRYPQAPSTSCMVRPILCTTPSRAGKSSFIAIQRRMRESGVKDHDPHENRDAESTAGRR
jgi:hypothetical protein